MASASELYKAIKTKDFSLARKLIENNSSLLNDELDENKTTPLLCSIEFDNPSFAEFLVIKGADVNLFDTHGQQAINLASAGGYCSLVRILIDAGANANAKDYYGCSPLHWAVFENHTDIVKLLIANGADVNSRDDIGWTPLSCARYETARLLIDAGADVAARASNGWTPLHKASAMGRIRVVELLIDNGADINAAASYGWTPLAIASKRNFPKLVEFLIGRGADEWPMLVNRMMEAVYLADAEKVMELIERNPKLINAKKIKESNGINWETYFGTAARIAQILFSDKRGRSDIDDKLDLTPLHLSVKEGHYHMTSLLINRGADIQARDNAGNQPVHWAAALCDSDILELLLNNNADPAAVNYYGQTPLHWSAFEGNVESVKLLIRCKVDINCKAHDGRTPLSIAKECDQKEVVAMLRSQGAGPGISVWD